jgi:hypothetical protein
LSHITAFYRKKSRLAKAKNASIMGIMNFKIPQFDLNKEALFASFGIFWLGLAWLALLLALFGIFYNFILAVYLLVGFSSLAYVFWKNRAHQKISPVFLLVLIFSLLAIFIFSYFSTPTIFSGRDQGSLSEAAIRLAQNHQLEFSSPASREFFEIYGPGKALNFPGFNYTATGNLITQFPLGYIAWLATFFGFFGLNGLVAANAASFFIFLLSFFLLARKYSRAPAAFAIFFLTVTSFIFFWFFKFTLGENLVLGFLWFGIFEFVSFLKNQERLHLLASFLALGFLCFVRVEALAFLAIIFAILLFQHKKIKFLFSEVIGKKISYALLIMAAAYVFSIAINIHFYIAFIKGFLGAFSIADGYSPDPSGIFFLFFYVMKTFSVYAVLPVFLLGTVGCVYFFRKKQWEFLLPGLIILPSCIYLFNPSISLDHPWMLRRFVFAIIPAGIFYAVLFLAHFFRKKIYFYAAIVLVAAGNLSVLALYLPAIPHKNLLPQVREISENFDGNDLILVDRDATGDGWSMMAGPMNFLFGKQAVYFFNPADLEKIKHQKFEKIYLIIPDKNIPRYQQSLLWKDMRMVQDFEVRNILIGFGIFDKLSAYDSEIILPAPETTATYGKIYLYEKL